MAEIRINATGGVKLYDADDSHYAQIVAGTITSNVDAITLGHDVVSIVDNLALTSDSAVLKFGADNDTTLTHTDGTGLTLNSTNKLCFNDASQFVQGSSATVLSIGATDEIDLTATAIDINGTCDISGTFSLGGTNITTTAAEINLIDGGTSRGTTALADGDGILINDAGTMRMTNVTAVKTYMATAALAGIDDQTSSNDDQLTITDSLVVINEDSDDLDFRVESDDNTHMIFVDGSADTIGMGGSEDGAMKFLISADGEFRIGGLAANPNTGGGTGLAAGNGSLQIDRSGGLSMQHTNSNFYWAFRGDSGTNAVWNYRHGGSSVGSISYGSSATSFNTSSDYRLKENVDYDWDATTRLKQLKPARFNWIIDETNTLVD